MQAIVTAKEMAAMDNFAIRELHIPGIVLMENAGTGIVKTARSILKHFNNKNIHIYCGPGNNGGDGFVVARHLLNNGASVDIFVLSPREKISGDALINLDILEKTGHKISFIDKLSETETPDLVVDAMLGTGVKGPLKGLYADCVNYINSLNCPVLAVDIPTGVHADTGEIDGPALKASFTATMALPKQGLLFSPGREHAGHLIVIDIGMPPQVVRANKPEVWKLEEDDIIPLLPQRAPDAYKNKCGTVAVIAGSTGFTGAAALTSKAVLRAGAGLCYLCIPESLNSIIETKLTEVITWPVKDDAEGILQLPPETDLLKNIQNRDSIAIGPGTGRHPKTAEFIFNLLSESENPAVLDADGLNICADNIQAVKEYKGEMILTPHPGELSRLTGRPVKEIMANRIGIIREFSKLWGKILVLKGGPSLIGFPDGRIFIKSTGNAGMATAGSGDVLTGVIAGLLAQGLSAQEAALAGVYLHGLAGDLAKIKFGEHGMIAGDILKLLPEAFKKLSKSRNG